MDWAGLLAWSTKYHDGTAPSKFSAMSDEDKQFLEKAMEQAFAQIEDPNKIFKEAIDQIRDPPVSDELALTILETIDRCCDDPDVARNLEVFDGIRPLLALLGSANTTVVARACEVLALMVANNPKMQRAAYEKGALDLLMAPVPNDIPRWRGQVRLLTAIVASEETVEQEFLKRDGVPFLGHCMCSGDEKIVTRAASFMRHLLVLDIIKPTEETAGYVAKAVADLRETAIQSGEILACCAKAHSAIRSKDLKESLKARIKFINDHDDVASYQEEVAMTTETIQLLQ